ncbi:MAG: outer membrane beta-barrel protein [Saprospiraceae bacterium]|nr:outer membrane beta-barrel protein [Saprospiraceae bacterium]
MKKSFLSILLLLGGLWSAAQPLELGLMGGVSLYSGDLAPKEFGLYFDQLNPAFGIFMRKNFNNTFSARIGASLAKVEGSDANIGFEHRGINFRSQIFEVALTGELNLFRLGSPKRTQVVPYAFAGVGIYHFNPETLFDDNWIELQPLGTEGQGLPGYDDPYSLTQVCLPFGGGLKFVFKEVWTLGFEFGGRKLFTDHLDDVSGAEVNYVDILTGNGTLAAQLSNPLITNPEEDEIIYTRGGEFQDWYFMGGVTVSFKFGDGGGGRGGRQLGCPGF